MQIIIFCINQYRNGVINISNFSKTIYTLLNKNCKKSAVIIKKGECIHKINYFDYSYEIYSLCNILKEINKNVQTSNVAIISENRYERNVAYFANVIAGNKIYLISPKIEKVKLDAIIKKYNIKILFFSTQEQKNILEIFNTIDKNQVQSKIKEKKTNHLYSNKSQNKIPILINFDSNNNTPQVLSYEKTINKGKYLENYNTNNIYEESNNDTQTVIINDRNEITIKKEELFNILKNISPNKNKINI